MANSMRRFDEKLQHETGHFSSVQPVGRSIVEQGDIFGTLNESIKIVSVDSILVFDSSHAESFAQIVGDEG